VEIPIEIQKQAVDLDEKMFGVAAPAVGPWQRQLNELRGVKPLAFGQYGELGPGFEQLLDQLAEGGAADEAAKRYLIPNRVVAKGVGVQLRLLRQRVVMAVQKAQAGRWICSSTALLTTHAYRGGTPRRRGAMRKASSTAQPRQGRGLTATSMRTTALGSTEWAARPIRAGRAAPEGLRRRRAVRAPLLCMSPPPRSVNHRLVFFAMATGSMKQKAAAAASKRVVKMGSCGSGAATGIGSPVCCAFSADGPHLFVTDQLNNRIKTMCCKGGPVESFGSVGRGDGEFVLPGGVSVALGLVFVADTNSSRVSVWTASRKFCCSFGERGGTLASLVRLGDIGCPFAGYARVSTCSVSRLSAKLRTSALLLPCVVLPCPVAPVLGVCLVFLRGKPKAYAA
jgi:hypothetical protein